MQTITLLETREAAPGQHLLTFTRPDGWAFRAGQFARIGLASTDPADSDPV